MKKLWFTVTFLLFAGFIGAFQIFPPGTGGSGGGGCTTGILTAILKGNGAGGCIAAIAGTDYVGGQAGIVTANKIPKNTGAGLLGDGTLIDNGTSIVPTTDSATDLGISVTQRFKSLFLSSNITAGGSTISATSAVLTVAKYATANNCASSASPAVCTSSAGGGVVIASGATTVQVNTSALVNGSQIQVTFDASLGTKLSVTCNTTFAPPYVTARTSATSFTISTAVAPITNPACYSYSIFN